jgi:hypothetical protein
MGALHRIGTTFLCLFLPEVRSAWARRYAIDHGDTIFAPQFKAFLKDACAVMHPGARSRRQHDRNAPAPP